MAGGYIAYGVAEQRFAVGDQDPFGLKFNLDSETFFASTLEQSAALSEITKIHLA